jgi:hypothetical protein
MMWRSLYGSNNIVILIIALLMVVIIVGLVFIFRDLMSYTATGKESMSPSRNIIGNALVVYAPGISGMAKNAVYDIANKLKYKSYHVDLVGVRSAAVIDTSDYDIIIAGGPMYFGKVSKSIDTYLKTIKLHAEVKLGLFATTGTDQFISEDFQSFTKQVEMLTVENPLNKKR